MSDTQHTILERLNRAASEAAREALTAEFEARGLDFSDLHPMIRVVLERGAIYTANAKQRLRTFSESLPWPTGSTSPPSKSSTPL